MPEVTLAPAPARDSARPRNPLSLRATLIIAALCALAIMWLNEDTHRRATQTLLEIQQGHAARSTVNMLLRRLVEAGTRIVQLGYATEGGDVDEIVNTAQAEIYAVSERRTSEDYVPLRDIINPTMEEIERNSERGEGMVGVPTGFTDLDALTNGLHGGQMIIIAARPAIGKSTLAVDICRAASIKHNLASVIFSLEMGRTELTMRLLAAEAGVPLQNMRKGEMKDDDWQRVASALGRVSDAPLFIDDSPNMSLMEIRAKCRRLKQRHDLRLVVVDYLQLMSSG